MNDELIIINCENHSIVLGASATCCDLSSFVIVEDIQRIVGHKIINIWLLRENKTQQYLNNFCVEVHNPIKIFQEDQKPFDLS